MLETICTHIHNYFDHPGVAARYRILEGVLSVDGVAKGAYYRIIGSDFNDGVHRHPADDLIDEVFVGEVRVMRPPRAFMKLVDEIAAWRQRNGAAAGPFQSESVAGVYSYRRRGDSWQDAFAGELNEWRRLS